MSEHIPTHRLQAGAVRARRLLNRDYPPAANKPTVAYIDAMADVLASAGVDPEVPCTLVDLDAHLLEGAVYKRLWSSGGVGGKQLRALSLEYSPFVSTLGKGFPKALLESTGVK